MSSVIAIALVPPVMLAGCAATPPLAPRSVAGDTSSGPAPGWWQLVVEIDDLPGTGKIPPQTLTLCSTPEDKKQWQQMVGGESAAGCTVKDYLAAGPSISYTMQCGGGIEGRTTIRIADADHYGGDSVLTMTAGLRAAVIRSRFMATRLATECGK